MLNWPEHKRFIIVTAAVILVGLLTYLIIIAPARRKTAEAQEQSEQIQQKISARVSAGQIQDDKNIGSLIREKERIEEKLSELKQRMLFRLHPRYETDPADSEILIEFNMLLQERKDLLIKSATRRGITIPNSFGFPTRNISELDLPDYFERLDIIERVINLAIPCGVAGILSINQAVDTRTFLFGMSLENKFIRYQPVVIKFKSDFKTISDFLYELLVTPRFLALLRVSLENDNPNVDSIKLTLAVGGLKAEELSLPE